MGKYYGAARYVGTSSANSAQTVSTSSTVAEKLRMVTVKYSGSVTKTVTVTLNSGAGSGYDTLIQNISLSANTDGVFIPDSEVTLNAGDTIDVAAPAGGAGVTSAVAIYADRRGD